MRNIILVFVIVLGLVVCGGGFGVVKVVIVEVCMEEDGGIQKLCICFVDLVVEKFDFEIVDVLVEVVKVDDFEVVMVLKMGEFGLVEMGQFVEFMMEVFFKCEMSMQCLMIGFNWIVWS